MRLLLDDMIHRGASDLHITVGSPPVFRLDGKLHKMAANIVSEDAAKKFAYSIMTEKQKQQFEENWEVDLSFGIKGLSRFRCNVFLQRGSVALAVRAIPFKIHTLEELGLPESVGRFADYPRGLILVCGPTGSGKSTTLAAIIDKINRERHEHILTVEDPIEFVHRHKNCIVNQREVHSDTVSFSRALKYALREDPDVVLIGEMRDLETISSALTIAETGHLAFATLHTNSAAETINRIIDVFPTNQQTQVRVQLSFVLQAVLTQTLVPKIGGGRVVASEVMVATPAVRAQIRDDKIHQLYSTIQAGGKFGMQTLNSALADRYLDGVITLEDCMGRSPDPQELNDIITRRKAKDEAENKR
ncbi:MAG TPA: type IV pilus twitching motility protein PilT [candidate division Zixibacteria bacterium]|nr:type IV pilus twitching motility protein PilT [candidate division Zixibacteria bacterium]